LWYVVVPQKEPQLAGTVGFKGKPRDGSCEIGYTLLPGFEGFGYATEAAQRLIEWAFQHPGVEQLTAETLPDLARSHPRHAGLSESNLREVSTVYRITRRLTTRPRSTTRHS